MTKTILVTGSTDGIGLATAKSLIKLGHHVILHGRNSTKLAQAKSQLIALDNQASIDTYQADLSKMSDVMSLASEIMENHTHLDVLINNAGVYVVPETVTVDGLDTRFMVNTIAPYLLTQQLLPIMNNTSRVVNLSSAAQAPINADELLKPSSLSDGAVYAKSKLAITMWTRQMALTSTSNSPLIVAVNPASMLGSKMVKNAYGVQGGDLQIGANVLVNAAISDEFSKASGLYFDNDIGRFTSPHSDALNNQKIAAVTNAIEQVLAKHVN